MTPATEDYIKTVFYLEKNSKNNTVSTSSIAEWLNIKDSSVTSMIKKLAKHKLIKYESRKGVRLTNRGEQTALKIIRKHRLLEIFLNEKLYYKPEDVHAVADKLEHYVSDELMKNIEDVLGERDLGVHGEEIPSLNNEV